MNKIIKFRWIIFFSLIYIMCCGGGVQILIWMERNHTCLANYMKAEILHGENYFSADTWFSSLASVIGAIISAMPGFICGVIALLQTQRLHEKEARYHRPSINLGDISLLYYPGEDYKEVFKSDSDQQLRNYIYPVIDAVTDVNDFMMLKIDFNISNDIPIKEMYIQKVKFIFEDDSYEIEFENYNSYNEINKKRPYYWDFRRENETNMHTAYTTFWKCSLITKRKSLDDFVERFKKYAYAGCGTTFLKNQKLELEIYACVQYEFHDNETAVNNLIKARFDSGVSDVKQQKVKLPSICCYSTFDVEGK